MKRFFPVFGILSSICYIGAVILGGFLFEGYSHIYNTISELTASGAPALPGVQILFAAYNLLLILFGIGLFRYSIAFSGTKMRIVSGMLAAIGLLGIGMYFFPQDPRDIDMTFGGRIHIALAGVTSVLTMVAILLAGMSFKRHPRFGRLGIYSYGTFAVLFVTGGLAAVSVARDSAIGGLFERLTIGAFIQWVMVVSLCLFQKKDDDIELVGEKHVTLVRKR